MKKESLYDRLRTYLDTMSTRSAWKRGVATYATELVEELESNYDTEPQTVEELNNRMLNGASNWNEYSWGGSALIYDCDIAARLCTPSELKKTRNGERHPNSREEWLDTQARALYQASRRVKIAYRNAVKGVQA